jgi:predicted lipoprotein with Yx(FWY)xxD motif
MKKSSIAIIAILIVAVLTVGGYVVLHKPGKAPAKSTRLASSTSSGTTTDNAILVQKTSSSLGQYLTEPNGQALYTFGGDESGVSNCTGSCLASWPAYLDKGSTTNLPTGVGIITRSDNGATQFTYNHMPLYTFVGDGNGQVTGNGVSNFTVAKPASTSTSTSSTPPSTNSSSPSSSGASDW